MNFPIKSGPAYCVLTAFLTSLCTMSCENNEKYDVDYREDPQIEDDSQIEQELQTRASGLCKLQEVGGTYILGSLGAYGLTNRAAGFVNSRIDETLKIAEEHSKRIQDSLDDISAMKNADEVALRMAKVMNTVPGKVVVGIFRTIPYIAILNDVFTMIRAFGTVGCSEANAIAAFVADNINVAHNQNLQRIWDNAAQDAQDELKDIKVGAEGVMTANTILLNSFNYSGDYETTMNMIAESLANSFTNNFNPLIGNMFGFKDRMEADFHSKWSLASAVAYKKFIELTIHLYKAHLSAARGVNIDDFMAAFPERAAYFKGASGHAYEKFLSFVETISPVVKKIHELNSQSDAVAVEYACESNCYDIDNDDWKITLRGVVNVKLYGNELISYSKKSGHELELLDLMKLLPEQERSQVPTYKKTHVVGTRNRVTVTYDFDDDEAWPGRYVTERTGIKNSTRRVYRPYNKWLGKGKDGFWQHLFNQRKIHAKYYEVIDSQVSALVGDIRRMVAHTTAEFDDMTRTLETIESEVAECAHDMSYESLLTCEYFSDSILDAIKLAAGNFKIDAQSSFLDKNAALPGRIEAEDYDTGGPGVSFFDTTEDNIGTEYRTDTVDIFYDDDEGGSYGLGWLADGEWVEYSVDVKSGYYDVELRVASGSDEAGNLELILDSVPLVNVDVLNTGGWHNWTTVRLKDVYLTGGDNKVLRLNVVGGFFNINWINVVGVPLAERIDRLYEDVLGRATDPGVLDFWLDEFDRGKSSLQVIAKSLFAAEEFERKSPGEKIAALTRIIVLREPNHVTLPVIAAQLENGEKELHEIAAELVDSPEFLNLDETHREYVTGTLGLPMLLHPDIQPYLPKLTKVFRGRASTY